MSKKLQKTISVFTSLTTILWLSGIAMIVPISVGAVTVVDGDIVRNPDAAGLAQFDVYIAKLVGDKKFKRLILSPHVFASYGHLKWENLKSVDQATMDAYTTSDLVREINDTKVYKLTADGDTGTKQWVNMTAADFVAQGYDGDSIYTINDTDRGAYTTGSDVTVAGTEVAGAGTLAVTLAADTPAASIAVENAARVPFTKVNLTASGGDVTVDSLVVERTGGAAQDGAFSTLDVIDGDTNLPISSTGKTLNSLHQATFNDDVVVKSGATKALTLAGNMPASLDSYAGEVPTLSLASMTLKGEATLNATLPITGNAMTMNGTITIGTATIQRGAYTNASSTSIQVGKQDYTFFSFQIQAGSAEKVKFSQLKVYQEGSAGLGTDVINLELLQDTTKIADGVVQSGNKYVNFTFDEITIDKGKTIQYQVRADIDGGSARTVDLGIYRTTDLLVKGITYGYNITPTYSSTGSSGGNPVLSDNEFTISNGTLQVTRSSAVGADNIGVANDQYLGAFTFTGKGEKINVSALTLTITSSTGNDVGASALLGVELVDPNGTVVAGPTDPTGSGVTVSWTDTFTVPVGETIYKVRGDLQTSANWASDDTVYVSFTPSAMTATGDTTGNSISATPSSSVSSNTQTVKAATLTITRNTLPATGNIIINQKNVNLSSWNFSAVDSGENIRITSILFAGRGNAATNTDALTVYAAGKTQSPTNDALAASTAGAAATSTFAFDSPIIVTKGTSVTIELHGDKDTVVSNDTENWGLTDDGGASVIAYGVNTGNSVTETLTEDDGPTLTSVANGELTTETVNNPSSTIVLAGTTGNVFSNVKLSAKYEDLRLDQLIVYVADGSYGFNAASGEYRDFTNVGIYDGTTKLAEAAIPSSGTYTFNFNVDLNGDGVTDSKDAIPKGGSKTLTIKADMSTIDPDTDNSPGTNSADLKIGFGGINGIKTTGKASNTTLTTSTYEIYRDSTSSAMVLRSSKPTVVLASSSDRLGAASSLTNGSQAIFAFKLTASASGGEVLLYRTTFVFATSGNDMTLTNVLVKDQNGNTIKAAANPTSYDIDGNTEYWQTVTFDNPDFTVDTTAPSTEAIAVPSGESRTFKVFATVSGAGTGENLSTFLVGDTASTSDEVNDHNFAVATDTVGFTAPTANLTGALGNFIWSDNYKKASISGIDGNNATSLPMWYNGHLVPGLENAVSTTPYVIGWSG